MYAARVDSDRLLSDTPYAPQFGLSTFAIARGARVENIGRRDNYAVTFDLLQEHFGFGVPEVIPLDLRHGFPPNQDGLKRRATATAEAIEKAIRGEAGAPNVIDGAVLATQIAGATAWLEADGVGAKTGPVFHINEFKGWPVVDGKADDAGKLGETVRQMGIYRYLLLDLVDRLGGDLEMVSTKGLLVTPKNVGLTLVGSPVELDRATSVAATTLPTLPDPSDYKDVIPESEGFGPVGDTARPEADRLASLDKLTDTFGTHYTESCLSSCGLAKFCREKVHRTGATELAGGVTARFLPGVASLHRAADLVDGAPATPDEEHTGVASILAAAGSLYRTRAKRDADREGAA